MQCQFLDSRVGEAKTFFCAVRLEMRATISYQDDGIKKMERSECIYIYIRIQRVTTISTYCR